MPRQVALEKQRESQVLLLTNWDDPREKGVYSGRVFEYLAARRPILAVGGSEGDVVSELLNETRAGKHAPTTECAKNALGELYQEYESEGSVAYQGRQLEIDKYSYVEKAGTLAEILDSVIQ